MDADASYYGARAAQERLAGTTAASEEARSLHFELAAAYETKVAELAGAKRRSTLHISTGTPISRSRQG